MTKQRVLVLIKPDAVQRGLIGRVIKRFEQVGLKITGFKFVWAEKSQAEKFYPINEAWYQKVGERTLNNYAKKGMDAKKLISTDNAVEIGKKVKDWLTDFLMESPVLCTVMEGYDAITLIRKMCGDTIPLFANPGTIRGDFAYDNIDLANEKQRPLRNIIHASDNPVDAEREIKVWFKDDEIFDYERIDDKIMFG